MNKAPSFGIHMPGHKMSFWREGERPSTQHNTMNGADLHGAGEHTVHYTGVYETAESDDDFIVGEHEHLPVYEPNAPNYGHVHYAQNHGHAQGQTHAQSNGHASHVNKSAHSTYNGNGVHGGHPVHNTGHNNNESHAQSAYAGHGANGFHPAQPAGHANGAGIGNGATHGQYRHAAPEPVPAPEQDYYEEENDSLEDMDEQFVPHMRPYPTDHRRIAHEQISRSSDGRRADSRQKQSQNGAAPSLFPRGISKPALASQSGTSQSSPRMNDIPETEISSAPEGRDDGHDSAPAPTSPLSLLGRSETRLPASPEDAVLETFANPSPHRDYLIQFQTEEFTSMCPVTGQPDFAKITLEYVPDVLCVESKSLKFYLAAFRNQRAFNESVTNRILDDFVNATQPRKATVKGAFAARGGISLTVTADYVCPPAQTQSQAPAHAAASGPYSQPGQSATPTPARATGSIPLPKAPGAAAPAEVPSHRPLLRRPLGQMARSENQGRSETETRVL